MKTKRLIEKRFRFEKEGKSISVLPQDIIITSIDGEQVKPFKFSSICHKFKEPKLAKSYFDAHTIIHDKKELTAESSEHGDFKIKIGLPALQFEDIKPTEEQLQYYESLIVTASSSSVQPSEEEQLAEEEVFENETYNEKAKEYLDNGYLEFKKDQYRLLYDTSEDEKLHILVDISESKPRNIDLIEATVNGGIATVTIADGTILTLES